MSNSGIDGTKLALAALFITSLVSAQLIAVKILVIPIPETLPFLDPEILVPAGVLAYALTFVASDCYTELYGRKSAHTMVNIGFIMNFVMLALVWLAIYLPGSELGANPDHFSSVLGLSTNIVIASLVAYIISQNWDVFAFAKISKATEGRYLWIRNLGSTATSQIIDTVIFISIAFLLAPLIIGVGEALPALVILQLIVGQYLIKLLIAFAETPLVYAIVGFVRSNGWAPENPLSVA